MASLFENVFTDMFGGPPSPGGAGQTPAAVAEWIRRFVLMGGPKIAARLMAQDRCEHPTCATRALAASRCINCKRVVCLDHVALFQTGDGICFTCAGVRPVEQAPPPPAAGQGKSAQDAALYASAIASLRLTPGATREEVAKRVKELRFQCHPDRAKPQEGDQAKRQFELVGQAYDIIQKYRGWT